MSATATAPEPPPMVKLMGIELVKADEGRVVFESEPAADFYNATGSVHGGYAATLLGTALGCAVHTTLLPGGGYATLGLEVKYVRPITLDTGRVRTTAEVAHRGRRQATATASLTAIADNKLLAHGQTTCLISRRPARPFGTVSISLVI